MVKTVGGTEMVLLYDRVKEIVDDFDKSVEDRRWIPVTERLPEEDGVYECTIYSEKWLGSEPRVENLWYWKGIIGFVGTINSH